MPRIFVVLTAIGISASVSLAQPASSGPYRILRTAKVGGTGGFDYVFADAVGRRLYIPRSGQGARVTVFNLDTLEPVGEIPNTNARGATVDPKSGHGFSSSKPVAMWDTKTLAVLKTIDVQGNPDGILFDPFNQRVWVFSHSAPNATIIDARDGSVVGTLDLGGAPEQAVTDGNGHLYVAIEDKDNVAVVDTRALQVTAHHDISTKAKVPAGLAFDVRNKILFVGCRNTPTMVIMTTEGKILAALPIGAGVDGAVFNPATMQTFSSQGDGTLTIVKENGPTSFVVEQTLQTKVSGKTLTLDPKTNHIFVIAADYTPPPAAPPTGAPGGGRGGRGQMVPDSFSIIEIGK